MTRNYKIFTKSFFKRLLPLALPVALHEFIMSALNMVDTVMIGRYDNTAIAAVNLANQLFFLFILFLVGITTGSNIFTAQYWGNRDNKGVRKVVGIILSSSVIISLIFMCISLIWAESFMHFYTTDENLIAIGAKYLKIVGLSFPLTAITFSFSSSLRSINNPKLPLKVGIIALSFNSILNYILIYGHLGAPRLGVEGAAIATLASRILETTILIIAMKLQNSPIISNIKDLFSAKRDFIFKLFKTSSPVLVNEVVWALGFSYYNKVYASIGTDSIAAVSVVGSASMLFLVLFFGTANATSIMIGNSIGENKLQRAEEDANRIIMIIPLLSIFLSVIMFFSAPIIPKLFGIESDSITNITVILFRIFAIQFPFKIINLHAVNGVLRSGGDTTYAMLMDMFGIWLLGVPTAVITTYLFHLPIEIVYFAVGMEDVVKAIFSFHRIKSGKWINRVI